MSNTKKFNFICQNENLYSLDFFLSECFITVILKTILPLLFVLISISFSSLKSLINIYLLKTRQYTQIEQSEQPVSISVEENAEPDKLKSTPASKYYISPSKYNYQLLITSLIQLFIVVSRAIAIETSGGDNSSGRNVEPIVTVAVWTYIAFLAFLNRTSQARLYELRFFYIMLSAADFLKLRSQLFVETHALNYIIETIFNSAVLLLDVYLMINSLQLTKKITKLNSNALNEKIYPSTEMYSSIFNRLTFGWVGPLLEYGYRNSVNLEDIWTMDEKERTKFLSNDFHNFETKATSFEGRLFIYFLVPLMYQSFWWISAVLIEFLDPYLLYLYLNFINASSSDGLTKDFYTSVEFGFYLVCGMLATKCIKAVIVAKAQFIGTRLGLNIKTIAIAEVYRKILQRKDKSSVKEGSETSNAGRITNLMSVDCNELALACGYFNYIYTIPIQISVSLFALYSVLGWAAFVALGVTLILIPINKWVSNWWDKVQQQLMAASDKRMDNINELLQGIRIIKFFAWEDQFSAKVKKSREAELKLLTIRTIVWIIVAIIWFCFPIALTCICFVVYTKVAGNDLTSPVAFTALLILKLLREPIDILPSIFNTLVQAKVALGRINKFLNEEDTSKYDILTVSTTSNDPIIGFKNATLEWEAAETSNQDSDENENNGASTNTSSIALDANPGFKIINLNLSFPEKELSIIAGPTGCGKTSMLLGLLGEMSLTSGQVFLPKKFPVTNNQHDHDFSLNGGIAYVSQTAWIQQATIRDNILFGEPFNQQRYSQVIKICALLPDFQTLTDGDLTEVGEKGITLSGGQKQRVSLARAVYSRASHIIMDDCLSAVDAHTAKHLFHQCIMGDIMKGRTRILVTHNISLTFLHASYAVVMGNNGTISGAGKPEDLSELKEIKDELNSKFQATSDEDLQAAATDNIFNLNVEADPAKKLVEDEERAIGRVKLSIYFAYLKAVGGIPYWIIFGFLFLINSSLPFALEWWMKEWSGSYDKVKQLGILKISINYIPNIFNFSTFNTHCKYIISSVSSYFLLPLGYKWNQPIYSVFTVSKSDEELNYYITVYIAIGLTYAISFGLRDAYQFYGSLKASRRLHDSMLHKVLRAPIRFFDTTPIGRIVNRFSKDMETIDSELMSTTEVLIFETISMIFTTILITYTIPAFVFPVLAIFIIYNAVTQYYVTLSRELNRIESVTRSPIYTQCSETINGVVVIRAFEQESRFLNSNNNLVDDNMRSYFYTKATNRWLEIRTDAIGGLIAFFCGLLLLIIKDKIGAGDAGFTLNLAITFSQNVHWLVRFYSNAEMSLNSVERIIEYLELESEAPRVLEDNRPPSEWPQNGHIEIKDLVLRYAKDLDPVIKGISLEIFAGEKIGVVGRTGAGKSTLALAFFRFLEATEGSITIDGVDISKIGVKDLRSNLTIIPQEAILFSGTIRSNLDPFSEHADEDLWKVLKRVHIVDREYEPSQNSSTEDIPADMETSLSVESDTSQQKHVAIKSLDQAVAENGQNFSQGQRQLLSLARALLRHSKVIIMDEATASVDYQTDAEIQRTIREEFQTNSLICIAHRLRTIIDYDKVLVMDKGTVAEFDTPYNLLYKSGGIFRGMCQESGEMEQLENLVTKPDDLINV